MFEEKGARYINPKRVIAGAQICGYRLLSPIWLSRQLDKLAASLDADTRPLLKKGG